MGEKRTERVGWQRGPGTVADQEQGAFFRDTGKPVGPLPAGAEGAIE